MRETTPVWSAWAEGRHDRRGVFVCGQQLNAPATPTAEGNCFGRPVPGATVHRGQGRFSVRSARKFIPEQSESYTESPSAAN